MWIQLRNSMPFRTNDVSLSCKLIYPQPLNYIVVLTQY